MSSHQHPEPAEEEDISRAGVYHDEPAPGQSSTGKGKQRADNPFNDDDDKDDNSEEEALAAEKGYPPTNDEEEESRRVAENLRRWEEAERQRRKAARESTVSVASSSLVGDVSRKASLLWPGRRRSKQAPPEGPGKHQQLRTSEDGDGVALDDLERISAPPTPEPDNPFATPAASTLSLNAPNDDAIMHESDTMPLPSKDGLAAPTAKKPSLGRSTSVRDHPPPQPLDLPAPRSPPPRSGTPHKDVPPEPIPPPTVTQPEPIDDAPEKRWWTDWLCGCREGGDHQAGRTNPFE